MAVQSYLRGGEPELDKYMVPTTRFGRKEKTHKIPKTHAFVKLTEVERRFEWSQTKKCLTQATKKASSLCFEQYTLNVCIEYAIPSL